MSALPLGQETTRVTYAIPYSEDAEEAVIGALMVNPSIYPQIAPILESTDFFILRHQYIWEAIQNLEGRGDSIDYLTISAELKAMDKLGDIGGPAYLTRLINSTPTSMHSLTYAKLVKRAAYRRQLMAVSDNIKFLALDEEMPIEAIQAGVDKQLTDLNANHVTKEDKPFLQLVSEYFEEVENLMNNPGSLRGIPTGFKAVDDILLGLQAPDQLVIAGRPGMGKSAYALSIAMNRLEADPDAVVGLFPLEMSAKQMTQRAAAIKAGINIQTLKQGKLTAGEWKAFVKAMGELGKYKLLMDDRAAITPEQLRSRCYRWLYQYKRLDYIIVDYLQLMSGGPHYEGKDRREQEISHISESLKNLAKELNIPVVALAQLNRNLESRADKRPVLSDLRESGAIEQNADVVMFLYRDEAYNPDTETPNQADIIIAKHRNGPTGTASLFFEKSITRFMNASERSISFERFNGGKE